MYCATSHRDVNKVPWPSGIGAPTVDHPSLVRPERCGTLGSAPRGTEGAPLGARRQSAAKYADGLSGREEPPGPGDSTTAEAGKTTKQDENPEQRQEASVYRDALQDVKRAAHCAGRGAGVLRRRRPERGRGQIVRGRRAGRWRNLRLQEDVGMWRNESIPI